VLERVNRQTAIVADDDPVIRAILRSVLVGIGLDVRLACHGHEAVGLAGRVPATLVLLDLSMPGLDGAAACARIRGLPGYESVPVIVLTGKDDAPAKAAAKAAGATLFLTKPFQPATLLQTLSGFCQISGTDRVAIARGAAQARMIARPGMAGVDQGIWR
jgi:two-component system, sensor histidine kinase and response regulator